MVSGMQGIAISVQYGTTMNGLSHSNLPEEVVLPPEAVIYGNSLAMRLVQHKVEKAASANVPVLLEGESGTGKDVLGRVIHLHSVWCPGPFVKLSCPAIPGTLLESELFGYERGAFTGAYGAKPGRVEMANRGTLFLDEIGEMDLLLQAKLLQLLQDGSYSRIGARQDRRIDVRVICATNRNLSDEIEAGRFRQDLFYRINVLNISLPPLRERIEDLEILVDFLLHSCRELYCTPVRPIPQAVLQKMKQYPWPGNIRELENLMRRYVILGSEASVILDALISQADDEEFDSPVGESSSLKEMTRQATRSLERRIIRSTLEMHGWNRKRTARALNISYRALLYKIKDAGIGAKRLPVNLPEGAENPATAGRRGSQNETQRSLAFTATSKGTPQ
jgi:two-component system, NtrC family, response regulator AtoC